MLRRLPQGIYVAYFPAWSRTVCQTDGSGASALGLYPLGGKPVGSVWLEKESAEAETAVLGVFLAEESCRGKYVGEEAVRLICRAGAEKLGISSVELHVRPQNSRAVRCYRKCGFVEAERFIKPNGVEVIHMIRKL